MARVLTRESENTQDIHDLYWTQVVLDRRRWTCLSVAVLTTVGLAFFGPNTLGSTCSLLMGGAAAGCTLAWLLTERAASKIQRKINVIRADGVSVFRSVPYPPPSPRPLPWPPIA